MIQHRIKEREPQYMDMKEIIAEAARKLILEKKVDPVLVIGVPVGFVNVVESKEALFAACAAHGVPAIAAMGRKGGSTVAAAVCNALVYSAAEMLDPAARGWK